LGVPKPNIDMATIIFYTTVEIGTIKEKEISVKNSGTAILKITDVDVSDLSDKIFTLENYQYPISINPNDTFNLKVSFKPTDTISYKHTITVKSNAPNDSAKKISLRGTGIKPTGVNDSYNTHIFKMKVQPNPVQSSAILLYELSGEQTEKVHLELYNTTGVKIRDILDGTLLPGNYTYNLQTESLPAGVYYISASLGQYIYHTKLVLLK
jgi:hypothetical protein